jgi:predicted RNA-binding Zn-ribbon protein involved in translation (DUF1610 family)
MSATVFVLFEYRQPEPPVLIGAYDEEYRADEAIGWYMTGSDDCQAMVLKRKRPNRTEWLFQDLGRTFVAFEVAINHQTQAGLLVGQRPIGDRRDFAIAEMLLGMGIQDTPANKMRARNGDFDPREYNTVAVCYHCGARLRFGELRMIAIDNGLFQARAGRAGWEWLCPECGEVVWRYYPVIN